jgi:hypothetical protein
LPSAVWINPPITAAIFVRPMSAMRLER